MQPRQCVSYARDAGAPVDPIDEEIMNIHGMVASRNGRTSEAAVKKKRIRVFKVIAQPCNVSPLRLLCLDLRKNSGSTRFVRGVIKTVHMRQQQLTLPGYEESCNLPTDVL